MKTRWCRSTIRDRIGQKLSQGSLAYGWFQAQLSCDPMKSLKDHGAGSGWDDTKNTENPERILVISMHLMKGSRTYCFGWGQERCLNAIRSDNFGFQPVKFILLREIGDELKFLLIHFLLVHYQLPCVNAQHCNISTRCKGIRIICIQGMIKLNRNVRVEIVILLKENLFMKKILHKSRFKYLQRTLRMPMR